MESVRTEHDEISRAARSVEAKLIRAESEFLRADRDRNSAEGERDVFRSRAENSTDLARVRKEEAEDRGDQMRRLTKDLVEKEDVNQARIERTHRIESELRDARGTLLEATSAAAEAESTVTSLRGVIDELRKENEDLYVQITGTRDAASKDRAKIEETLVAAESKVQKLRMQCETDEEELRKLRLDKSSAEKQFGQMKVRITNLERRLQEATTGNSRMGLSTSDPKTSAAADLGLINSFGAKNMTKSKSSHISIPSLMRSSLKSATETKSAYASYTSSNSAFSTGKENRTVERGRRGDEGEFCF